MWSAAGAEKIDLAQFGLSLSIYVTGAGERDITDGSNNICWMFRRAISCALQFAAVLPLYLSHCMVQCVG